MLLFESIATNAPGCASHIFRNSEFIPLWLGDLAIWRNKFRVPIQHHPSHPEQ
jgi:hypothetical protein